MSVLSWRGLTVGLCLLVVAGSMQRAAGRAMLQADAEVPVPAPAPAPAPAPGPMDALAEPGMGAPGDLLDGLRDTINGGGAIPGVDPAPVDTTQTTQDTSTDEGTQDTGTDPATGTTDQDTGNNADNNNNADGNGGNTDQNTGNNADNNNGDGNGNNGNGDNNGYKEVDGLQIQDGSSYLTTNNVPKAEGLKPFQVSSEGSCDLVDRGPDYCDDGMGDVDGQAAANFRSMADPSQTENCGVVPLSDVIDQIKDWAYGGRWGGCGVKAATATKICQGVGAAAGRWRVRFLLWPDGDCKPLCIKVTGSGSSPDDYGRTRTC